MSYERPSKRKEREYREETAAQRVTSQGIVDANAPSTAIPALIRKDPQNKYEAETQLLLVNEDPIARFVCQNIAEQVYDDWFIIVERGTKKEHPRNAELQAELERMNAKWHLTQALFWRKTNGHCWLDLIPPAEESIDDSGNIISPKIVKLEVLTKLRTTVTTWFTNGMPDDLEVTVRMPDGTDNILPRKAADTIFMRTEPLGDGSFEGLSELVPIFDALNYIRQVLFSMGWHAVKTGIGVFFVKVKGALTTEKKAAAEAMLTGLSTKRGVIYSDLIIDEFGFVQSNASNTNFPEYIKTLLGQIAVETGIPISILTGDNQGQIAGSEVNSDLKVAVLNTDQQDEERFLRELFERMGFVDMDYDFDWNARFATNEEQKSKILSNNTQADVQALSYMSVNEVRARRSLPPVPGGEEILGLRKNIEIGISGEGVDEGEAEEESNNPGGEQV